MFAWDTTVDPLQPIKTIRLGMEVVETEFEILRISKPVSLPFDGLDFVYETLDGTTSQSVEIEVVEKSSPVGSEGLAHSFERLDSGVHGVSAPHCKELFGLFAVLFPPEEPHLLFH
jgi:hypothetical protein